MSGNQPGTDLSLDAQPLSVRYREDNSSGQGAISEDLVNNLELLDMKTVKVFDVVLVFPETYETDAERLKRELSEVSLEDGSRVRVTLYDDVVFGASIVERPSIICEKSLLIFIIGYEIKESKIACFTKNEVIAQTRIVNLFHRSESVRSLREGEATGAANCPLPGLMEPAPILWSQDNEEVKTDLRLLIQTERDEERRRNDTSAPAYDVNENDRGICLIINNIEFYDKDGLEPKLNRYSAEDESEQLKNLFEKLKYKVESYKDVKTSEMKDIFKDISTRDHSKYDSFVCFIMSHGELDYLYGSDMNKVEVPELLVNLTPENCPTLSGKPKLCFIEACRKESSDGMKTFYEKLMYTLEAGSFSVQETSDLYVCYSTSQGEISLKSNETGDFFIKELTTAIDTRSKRSDLIGILGHVKYELSKRKSANNNKRGLWHTQKPEIVDWLRKRFYFENIRR